MTLLRKPAVNVKVMEISNQAWVNGGRGHDSLKVASVVNFQSDGNSNTRCSC